MNTNTSTSKQQTLFLCNCCGKLARAQTQVSIIPGRAPLTQVECVTEGCNNNFMTYTYREGDDNSQLTDLYTPVKMDAGQVARFVAGIEYKAKAS